MKSETLVTVAIKKYSISKIPTSELRNMRKKEILQEAKRNRREGNEMSY